MTETNLTKWYYMDLTTFNGIKSELRELVLLQELILMGLNIFVSLRKFIGTLSHTKLDSDCYQRIEFYNNSLD